jgi:hypothetical protein
MSAFDPKHDDLAVRFCIDLKVNIPERRMSAYFRRV